MLQSAGFGAGDLDQVAERLPVIPWISIDGPECVATSLSRYGKEAIRVS